jgi:hypothetical protein
MILEEPPMQSKGPLFLLVAVAIALTVPLSAETVNEWIPVPMETILACNGETVTLMGECHTVVHTRTDKNGGIHVDAHLNCAVDGIGSENVYRFLWNAKQSFDTNECLAGDEQTVSRQRLIGEPASDNLFLYARTSFVANENCEYELVVDVDSECR